MQRAHAWVRPTLAGVPWLEKPPLYYLLAALVVAGYVLVTREWGQLRRIVTPGAMLAFAVVAGPWYLAILRDQGRVFVDEFLLNHNLQRFTSSIHHHPGSAFYYVPLVVA